MRITIITEEELTYKVLAGFEYDFAVSGLGRSFHMLLHEGIDTLAAISTVADLDGVKMVT
jgi:hypothetical protein